MRLHTIRHLRPIHRRGRAILQGHQDRRATARALRAVAAFPAVEHHTAHNLPSSLVVSLTSYRPRFPTLALTLRSLLDQRTEADRTVLWVTPEDLPDLPAEVLALRGSGLEIATVRNLRSYKKLVPALRSFPDCTIVTADDDAYYDPDWLTRLVATAKASPGAVVGLRCHMARMDKDGCLLPYNSWDHETEATKPGHERERLFPTGVGGILYPPEALVRQALDEDRFMRLCPSADDVWFFWMARLAGTRHRRAPEAHQILFWPDSQKVALFWHNVIDAPGNDEAIRALEAEFGAVP